MMAIRTALALSALERRALVEALGTVLIVRTLLWVLPSHVIIRRVRTLATRPVRSTARHMPSEMIVWAVQAASRRVPRATCLTQAVSGLYLLGRHGWTARLCLGVASGGAGGILAHAWLERDGKFLLGQGAKYTRMPSFPTQRPGAPGQPA